MNRRHAIIEKKVINHDRGGTHVMCAWDDCEKDGVELHKVRVLDTKPGITPTYIHYVFCSERHRQYWINSAPRDGSIGYGNLPAGYRSSIL